MFGSPHMLLVLGEGEGQDLPMTIPFMDMGLALPR
jgi:hypothetical protein